MSDGTHFNSGDLVLTKIKGFPEWPTRVVDFSLLPEHIQKLKPKSVSSSKSKGKSRSRRKAGKRSKDHGEVICVKFYGDDEYTWCSTNDLKPLSEDQVVDYLVKKGEIPDKTGSYVAKKNAKGKKLTEAYKLAYNKELSAEDFIRYGSEGKPAESEIEDEQEEEEEEEEKPKVAKKKSSRSRAKSLTSTSKSKKPSKSATQGGKKSKTTKRKAASTSTGSRKRAKSSQKVVPASSRTRAKFSRAKSRSVSKPKVAPKVESSPESQPEDESGSEDDWGDDIVEAGSGIVDIKTIPTSVELSKEANSAKRVYSRLRAKLQTIILGPLDEEGEDSENVKKEDEREDGEDNTEKKIDYKQKIGQLNPLIDDVVSYQPSIVSALRSTNLYRVLIIILKKPEYQKARFCKKLRKFLKDTLDVEVSEDKHWGDSWVREMDDKEEEDYRKKQAEEKAQRDRERAEARKEAKSREQSVTVDETE